MENSRLAKRLKRDLCFISRSDLSEAPYAEIALPALAQDGWDISIYAPGAKRSILQKVRPYPCKTYDLPSNQGVRRFYDEVNLLRVLMSAKFGDHDVVYINSQSLSARAALMFLGPKLRKKLVYHNPDYYDPFTHPFYHRLEGLLCRKADLYINNEFHRGYITQAVYKMRCPVVIAPPNLPYSWPIPVRSPVLRAKMCKGEDEPQFVLILHGAFAEIRMVPQLFKALSLLPSNFRLVMTGAAHRKEEVDNLLRQLKIESRVTRLPRLGFFQLFEYTVNADAGVLFYRNNDLGNFFTAPGRLTEYLSCGLPVVGTNHSGLESLILRYDLGESVDTNDPQKIAEGILRLERAVRSNRYARESLCQKFAEYFAFDHWEPGIIDAFNDLISTCKNREFAPPKFPWIPNSR